MIFMISLRSIPLQPGQCQVLKLSQSVNQTIWKLKIAGAGKARGLVYAVIQLRSYRRWMLYYSSYNYVDQKKELCLNGKLLMHKCGHNVYRILFWYGAKLLGVLVKYQAINPLQYQHIDGLPVTCISPTRYITKLFK